MRSSFRLLLVLAVAVLMLPAIAFAGELPPLGTATLSGHLLNMWERQQIAQEVELDPVSLPPPSDPDEERSSQAQPPRTPGPVGGLKTDDLNGFGASMVGPRGGGMSTPKQRADREIKLLIKRLG